MFGGELETRTLNALWHNGFQDHSTTNYHNSPSSYNIYDKNNTPTPDVGKYVEYQPTPMSGEDNFIPLTDARVDEILAEIGIS